VEGNSAKTWSPARNARTASATGRGPGVFRCIDAAPHHGDDAAVGVELDFGHREGFVSPAACCIVCRCGFSWCRVVIECVDVIELAAVVMLHHDEEALGLAAVRLRKHGRHPRATVNCIDHVIHRYQDTQAHVVV
jgi:hypothetical protein